MKAFITNPILRWIAVLPGAFLATLAAYFPWHWVVLIYANFVGRPEGEEVLGLSFLVRLIGPETVERLGYGFITPFVTIAIAAKIAPRHKLATGKVVALLIVAIYVFGAFFVVPQYNLIDYFQTASGWGKLYPVVSVALWVAGIYTALLFNKRRWTD